VEEGKIGGAYFGMHLLKIDEQELCWAQEEVMLVGEGVSYLVE